MSAITADFLAELIEESPNARGIYKDIIREFDNDADEPAYVDVSLMPFAKDKTHNQLKQSLLSKLPPKATKAPERWSRIVVRTPNVTLDDGTVEKHVYLMHIDRVQALAAAAANANNDDE